MGRIAAGSLDRRVSILRAGSIDDGTASIDGPYVEIGRRWAKKTDVSDGERVRAAAQSQEITSRFLVRSDALTRTITGKDRLQCRGVSYEVTGTKETDDRDDGIEITTVARPDQVLTA